MAKARVKLEDFGGMIPRTGNRLLPPTHAQKAQNVKLESGELRGMRRLEQLHVFPNTALKSYRIPDVASPGGYYWLGLDSIDTSVYRGPLLNDLHDRYYMFGDGRPKYNTLARIKNDDPWFWLGIPVPVNAPTVSAAGGTTDDLTRFYTYTFLSAYGEEGPPADPVSDVGKDDGTWTISNMDTAPTDAANRNVDRKRIYRTVQGFSSSDFFFVAEVPVGDAGYVDTALDSTITRNSLLESEQFLEPPAELVDAVVMPNGFFIAWKGRDVHFSETYRPHAWPPAYDLSTEFEIVGAGIFGRSAGLVTDGAPYVASGVNPEATTLTKVNTVEPGLSRHSVVSLPYGVLYASQNGLALLGANGVSLATQPILTKDDWVNSYSPETLIAAQYEAEYIGFYTSDDGFIIDPMEAKSSFSELDGFNGVDYIHTDPFTGDVIAMIGNTAWLWDAPTQPASEYRWRSKEFNFPQPCNIGAAHIDAAPTDLPPGFIEGLQAYNVERIQQPLAMLGYGALGESPDVPLNPPNDTVPQIQQPFGGSPLYDIAGIVGAQTAIRLNVYADSILRFSEIVGTGTTRLPAGFKKDYWSFEVVSRRTIFTIKAAETAKGLADV